jgi:endonuclease YncB( thermonuclease family)
MNIKKIDILILVFLVLAVLSLNYSPIDSFLEQAFSSRQEVLVERVIDGDTVESDIGNIRLLGINTPERGEIYYEGAKKFLESRIFNKTVELEFGKDKRDKYNRTLAYLFLDGKNINIEIVKNGFANYYFYGGRDKYSSDLENAWTICVNNKINLCEPSANQCSSCIIIKDSGALKNICGFSCNITGWKIKAEGRNNTIFQSEILNSGEEVLFKLELIGTGDTIFLRDREGKLALWKKY